MLVTESKLRQIVKEEYNKMMKKEGFYGRSRFGSSRKPRRSETQEARDAIEDAINENFSAYYAKRKEELASQGKGIKPEEEIRKLVEQEAKQWLSSYSYALRGGDEDDRHSSTSETIPAMPRRLQNVLLAGQHPPMIPNWDVRNNMYDGSGDY